ncbi:hypothetical protein Ciccas_005804 [Cichlidogyrus casuarinus]|uniref:Uncharacterized protein n=1 Tax=Cichlidogyrus casuarinus TaxID=1844966 RepID=A0ABD2Q7M1_9PLAT
MDLEDEIWQISNQQKAYYLSQFIRLQPKPDAFLSGQNVKKFFEKSKLEMGELSRIWELSDVSNDGYLSLGEFTVAMHLIVLRLNGIFLPPVLPESLKKIATTSAFTPMHPPEIESPDLIEFPSNEPEIKQQVSNLSDSTSLSGSVLNFDSRPVLSEKVAHPKAIRAEPRPLPPPRLAVQSLNSEPLTDVLLPSLVKKHENGLIGLPNINLLAEFEESQLIAIVDALKTGCSKIESDNNSLGIELMRIQQQRIVLELLHEHLSPLDQNF